MLLCTVSEEPKRSVGVGPPALLGAVATIASLEELKRSVGVACSGSTSSCASVWIFSPSRESVKYSHKFSSCNSLRILSFLKAMFDGHTVVIKGLTAEESLTLKCLLLTFKGTECTPSKIKLLQPTMPQSDNRTT